MIGRKRTEDLRIDDRQFSRADAERLLSGKEPESEGLQDLALAMRALQGVGEYVPTEEEARLFAAEAAKLAAETRLPIRARASAAVTAGRRRRLRPALAGGLAALVLMLAGSAGVAYASNDAAPGDTLYELDLALEKVGIGDGGLQERLQEATRLCERGEVEKGLNHAAEAVRNQAGLDENGQANSALLAAANAVEAANEGESELIQTRVKELFQWMATTETKGEEFGQGVTERTEGISGETGQGPAGPAGESQSGEPDKPQGQNGGSGQR